MDILEYLKEKGFKMFFYEEIISILCDRYVNYFNIVIVVGFMLINMW